MFRRCLRDGNAYRMKVSNVETVLHSVVTSIASKGLKIRKSSFDEPTMDKVFLRGDRSVHVQRPRRKQPSRRVKRRKREVKRNDR